MCFRQPMLATLFYDDVVRKYFLPIAESFRAQMPSCSRFRIRAEDTIRFVTN
jgi:hypothetical protein